MRAYAPLAVILAALTLLGFVAFTRFAERPGEVVLRIDPVLANQLAGGEAEILLVKNSGEPVPARRWQIRSTDRLVVEEIEGDSGENNYAFIVVHWFSGSTSFHPVLATS